MKRKRLKITSAIIGLILLIVVVSGLSRESGIASQPSQLLEKTEQVGQGFISHRNASPLAEGSPAGVWTKEAMLAAEPYPLELDSERGTVNRELSRPDGPPGVIASSPPGIDFPAAANSVETLATSETTVIGYDYPPPYARYQNFDSYLSYPYSTVGVLFFEQGGKLLRCSAASIGNYAIWTAGHCLHAGDGENGTGGTWSTNLRFVPAYRGGNDPDPLGTWTAYQMTVPVEWHSSSDHRYDFGGVVLNLNGGQKISQVAGSLGFAYNMDNDLHWMNIAYPLNPPFNGSTQQICAGSFAYEDTGPLFPLPPFPIAMGCDMTGGSSGGPWILNFSGSSGSSNLLNGINSYRYTQPEELYSPYFDSYAKNLRDALTSIIPPPP